MSLPLFQTPKPIDSHFKSDSDIVLFNGEIKDLLVEIPDNSIQLVITSPPYNIGKEYEKRLKLEIYLEQQAAQYRNLVGEKKEEVKSLQGTIYILNNRISALENDIKGTEASIEATTYQVRINELEVQQVLVQERDAVSQELLHVEVGVLGDALRGDHG